MNLSRRYVKDFILVIVKFTDDDITGRNAPKLFDINYYIILNGFKISTQKDNLVLRREFCRYNIKEYT